MGCGRYDIVTSALLSRDDNSGLLGRGQGTQSRGRALNVPHLAEKTWASENKESVRCQGYTNNVQLSGLWEGENSRGRDGRNQKKHASLK